MSTYAKLLAVLLRKPGLLPHALGAAWAFRARGWHRRAPFLPLPPREYVRWRLETAYGDPEAVPPADELERFLRWASAMREQM